MSERDGCVPIIEISDENFLSMWPGIKKSIEGASFIAVDCELSGLGDRSKLNYPEVDIRYENTAKIAQEYSIVSLGLSCFNCHNVSSMDINSSKGKQHIKSQNYCVQTYNILTLSTNPYTVESKSLKFLAAHGFDFNKQYTHGLEYGLPSKRQQQDGKPSVADIFTTIVKNKKPIVVHNGYIDLVYLYHNFYAELPKKADTFAADLYEMFPSGIYDTKYITEFHETFPATFLEYIFKKMQLGNDNRNKRGLWHVRLNFPPYPETLDGLNWHPFNQVHEQSSHSSEDLPELCKSYKFHGWCPLNNGCEFSHDINRIVRELDPGRKRRFNPRIADTSVAHIIHMKKQNMNQEPSHKRFRVRRNQGDSDAGSNSSLSCNDQSSLLGSDDEQNEWSLNAKELSNGSLSLLNGVNSKPSSSVNGTSSKGDSSNPITEFNRSSVKVNKSIKENSMSSIESTNGDLKSVSESVISNTDLLNTSLGESTISKNESKILGLVSQSSSSSKLLAHCSGHRAGFDAFMTGYIFACSVTKHGDLNKPDDFTNPQDLKLDHVVSRVYLIGKEFPFLIRSSSYSKTSNGHDNALIRLRRAKDALKVSDQD